SVGNTETFGAAPGRGREGGRSAATGACEGPAGAWREERRVQMKTATAVGMNNRPVPSRCPRRSRFVGRLTPAGNAFRGAPLSPREPPPWHSLQTFPHTLRPAFPGPDRRAAAAVRAVRGDLERQAVEGACISVERITGGRSRGL